METTTLTYQEYLDREIDRWGFEYISDLMGKGYTLELTTSGYKWLLPPFQVRGLTTSSRTARVKRARSHQPAQRAGLIGYLD